MILCVWLLLLLRQSLLPLLCFASTTIPIKVPLWMSLVRKGMCMFAYVTYVTTCIGICPRGVYILYIHMWRKTDVGTQDVVVCLSRLGKPF